MAKALTIGNGNILVNLDEFGQVRDFYFPHVGLENQVGGHFVHRIGIWVEGNFSWLTDPGWEIKLDSENDFLASKITAWHQELGVKIVFQDMVYNEKNIFVRKLAVKNLFNKTRELRLFFHQQFELYESHTAHTAYFDPLRRVIIHYRNQRTFLVNAQINGQTFDEYSTGLAGREGREGTYKDAEDGRLENNPIEHGPVDSVIRLPGNYEAQEEKIIYYWSTVAKTITEALDLNTYTLENGPGHLLQTTRDFWRAWVYRQNFSFEGLSKDVVNLFNKSLFSIRTHVDSGGAIIASADSNVLQNGKDTYCYTWMRDASYAALALTSVGSHSVSKAFFSFASQVISADGYFLHKYSPDGSLGSSWHPWLKDGEYQIPIQEDSTALVLYALWHYYEKTKDIEFIESIYNALIKKAADFLVIYREEKTGLPKPSYDLWEEKFGVSTFTAASVYGGLMAAANFAKVLGKLKSGNIYHKAAIEVKDGVLKYLYDEKKGAFYKLFNLKNGELTFDTSVDISSVYGIYQFNLLPPNDPRVIKALDNTVKTLACRNGIDGLARHENDNYCRTSNRFAGNPWIITTMWFAQHQIALAENNRDLDAARKWLSWTARYASPGGLLPEQLNPETGASISVSPLVWSHAEFVRTVIAYLDKMEELGLCKACNPVY